MPTVPLSDGGPQWRKLRAAQRQRLKRVSEELPAAPRARKNDAARRFWSQRAYSELAAVPAMAHVVLAMVREELPLRALEVFAQIASDEVRHARLSKEMADLFGGYIDETPEGLPYDPRSLAEPTGFPLAYWALANGCLSETVSLELIRARFLVTTHPVAKAVLGQTLKDEAVHVRVSWELAEKAFPQLTEPHRRELASYAGDLASVLKRSFSTEGLPALVRRRERKVRLATAEAGLGSLPPDEEDAVVNRALGAILARLRRLGLPAR